MIRHNCRGIELINRYEKAPKPYFKTWMLFSICNIPMVNQVSQTWNTLCPDLLRIAKQLEDLDARLDDG
jgi:hypothetical protein